MESGINWLLSRLAEPSILHWMALFFGDWIREFFNPEAVINYPVTALMVSMATLNIVAMATLLIILFYTGGRALLSGLATANIATGTSSFLPFRLLLAFGLLMPTTAGLDALKDRGLNISYAQANIIKIILLGGSFADYVWMQSAHALFDLNISGAPVLRNTYSRTVTTAQLFLCNEFYYRTYGQSRGESRYHLRTISRTMADDIPVTNVGTITSFDAIDDLVIVFSESESHVNRIIFGGRDARCGSIELESLPNTKSELSLLPQTAEIMPAIRFAMRNEANLSLKDILVRFDSFSSNYFRLMGRHSTSSVLAIRGDKDESVGLKLIDVNSGSSASAQPSDSINVKMNSLADELIYISQYYGLGLQAIPSRAGSTMINEMLRSGDISGVAEGDLATALFDNYMSGYISAGMFWSVYQEFSGIVSDAERYANGVVAVTETVSASELCNVSFLSSIWNSTTSGYECENEGHYKQVYAFLVDIMEMKANSSMFAPSIEIDGTSYGVDAKVWSGFLAPSNAATPKSNNFISSWVISFFEQFIANLIYVPLPVGEGTGITSEDGMPRGVLSGDDAMLMNLSGNTSPYVFLNQLGEGMRDLSFSLRAIHILVKSLSVTKKDTIESVSASIVSKHPLMAPLLVPIRYVSNVVYNTVEWLGERLLMLAKTLSAVSLILIYGLPAIPVIGWTMVVLGLFYTFGSAVAASPFAAALIGIPKGDGLITPDTERVLSLLYGVFVRQSLTVVGFVFSMYMGYVGMSLFNLIWFSTFLGKISSMGILDAMLFVIFIFVGYAIGLFFICLYSFRVTSMLVDTVGVFFSSVLVGGAFGSNDQDTQTAIAGIKSLSSQLDEFATKMNPSESSSNNKRQNDFGGRAGGASSAESAQERSDRKTPNA
ncbi:hypothetical protein QTV44_002607 [Vibrio vulnificus]|nr:hypothetical protein [Vibrio vulnificus]